MKTRRKFTAEFKAKVSLEAIKERESVSELAKKFQLHPNQINQWKKEFLAKSSKIFSEKPSSGGIKEEKDVQKLYETIGQQKVEIDFLRRALSWKPAKMKDVP